MLKIQYGIAGFFTGAFIGLLLAIIESRLINAENHTGLLFIVVGLTVIISALVCMYKAITMAKRKMD